MSEETTNEATNEALDIAQEAQSKKVFNLADAIKGRALPKKAVTIYLDEQSAMELYELNEAMNPLLTDAEMAEREAKAAELKKKIDDSALVVNMSGVNQKTIEEVVEFCNVKHNVSDSDNTENINWMVDYILTLVGKNIVTITTADGQVEEGPLDYDQVNEFRGYIPGREWSKLVETMQKLTLAGGYFEQLTDAGFLPKS